MEEDDSFSTDFLRDEIAVLIAHGIITFQDTTRDVQNALIKKFKVWYDPDRIIEEIEILWIENEVKADMENYKNGMSKFLYTDMIPEDFNY